MTSPKQALQARYIYDEAILAGWVFTHSQTSVWLLLVAGDRDSDIIREYHESKRPRQRALD